MELIILLRTVRRWLWLVTAIVVVTAVVIWIRSRSMPPVYEAKVRVQITSPQRDDVSTFDEYRYISLRDEIVVARNNFIELLGSEEVLNSTIAELALVSEAADYTLEVQQIRDVDFFEVAVDARDPYLAAQIANIHVAKAIAYYGTLRAKPTIAEKELFGRQLQLAEEELRSAENALAEFQSENGIVSLEDEISTNQNLLEQLQLDSDRHWLDEKFAKSYSVAKLDELIAQRRAELEWLAELSPIYERLRAEAQEARETYQFLSDNGFGEKPDERLRTAEEQLYAAESALVDFETQYGAVSASGQLSTYQKLLEQLLLERDRRLFLENPGEAVLVAEIDKLIGQRRDELARLAGLTPQYNMLKEHVHQALVAYQHLASKYNEAELKADAVLAANSVQIIEPALPPIEPVSTWRKLFAVGVVGSLVLGILLTIILDYVVNYSAMNEPAAEGRAPGLERETASCPSADRVSDTVFSPHQPQPSNPRE